MIFVENIQIIKLRKNTTQILKLFSNNVVMIDSIKNIFLIV